MIKPIFGKDIPISVIIYPMPEKRNRETMNTDEVIVNVGLQRTRTGVTNMEERDASVCAVRNQFDG